MSCLLLPHTPIAWVKVDKNHFPLQNSKISQLNKVLFGNYFFYLATYQIELKKNVSHKCLAFIVQKIITEKKNSVYFMTLLPQLFLCISLR